MKTAFSDCLFAFQDKASTKGLKSDVAATKYCGYFNVINTYSMKQSDLYYFETIKMTSKA